MAENSLEERSLEVLDLPDDFDEDFLSLYFENKRRSGGGDVESLERCGNKVVVVFKEAERKTRILCINVYKLQTYVSKSLYVLYLSLLF